MADGSNAYTVHIRFLSAKDIPAGDHKPFQQPTSDAFVAAYFEGNWGKKGHVAYSSVAEDTLTPVWPDTADNTKSLTGASTGTDVLVLEIWDKDHKQFADDGFTPYKKCDKLATGNVRISSLKFGRIEVVEVPLRNLLKKKVGKPGGVLSVQLLVVPLGTPAWQEVDYQQQSFVAKVHFRSAKDLPAADRPFLRAPTSDPYVVAKIRGAPDSAKKQTQPVDNTLNPTWNEAKSFTFTSPSDVLQIWVWDYDKKSSDEELAYGELSFEGLAPGKQHDFVDWPLQKKWKKGPPCDPKLTFSVSITEGTEPDEQPICTFDWGALNSSYATNFTYYDTEHGCHGLGEPTPDEEVPPGYHVHIIHDDTPKVDHPKTKLSGAVVEVKTALPKFILSVFQLKHGHLRKHSEAVEQSTPVAAGPQNLQFEFGVEKGSWFGVVLYDEGRSQQIAVGKQKTKTFQGGEQTVTLQLVKVPDFTGAVPPGGFGTATVKVNYQAA